MCQYGQRFLRYGFQISRKWRFGIITRRFSPRLSGTKKSPLGDFWRARRDCSLRSPLCGGRSTLSVSPRRLLSVARKIVLIETQLSFNFFQTPKTQNDFNLKLSCVFFFYLHSFKHYASFFKSFSLKLSSPGFGYG